MNNPRLKRKVLFDKHSTTKSVKTTPVVKKSAKKPVKETTTVVENKTTTDVENRSTRIYEWFNTHPYFKYTKLITNIGFDKGNFHKLRTAKKPLREEYVKKIEAVLANYGFKP